MSMNVTRLATAAAIAMVAVVGITLLLPSSSPSATAQQPGSRQTVTQKGLQFSFRVPTWLGGEPQHLDQQVRWRAGLDQQVHQRATRRRGHHLLDELPGRRLRRSVCPPAGPVAWPIGRRVRSRSVDGPRHQARHGAFERHPGRAPREARGAHRSRERRLRTRVLLHLASTCRVVHCGRRRAWATRSRSGSSMSRERLFIAAATTTQADRVAQEGSPADRRIDQVRLVRSAQAAK